MSDGASGRVSAHAEWRITWAIVTLLVTETVVCAVAAAPVAIAWAGLAAATSDRPWLRTAVFAAVALPSYAVFALLLLVVTPLAVRVTGWRTPADAQMRIADVPWPVLDWIRFMGLLHVARLLAGSLVRGTPVWSFHLRLCGARIGRRVYVNSLSVSDYNLLEFEDDVVVGAGVHLAGHTVESGVVKTGAVRLGRGVTIGLDSIVEIDVVVGAGCQVGAMSFIPKHTHLTEPGTYVGVPVARLTPHASAADR